MRIINLLLLLSLFCTNVQAQFSLSGTIRDAQSKEPLSYVNIGVIGANVGTVSGRDGSFQLEIPERNYSDLMRISIIGYESLEMEANQFQRLINSNGNIDLEPTNYQIDEVVIASSRAKSKVVGNKKWREKMSAGFGNDKLGNEMGIVIKIKKKKTFIKDFTFVLGINEMDTVRFRLNIYSMKDGKPDVNLLKQNVIIEAYKDDEVVTTNLEKYNIYVEDDFFISLEWIEDYPDDGLYFAASLFSQPAWSRETSQGDWLKIPFLGIGMYATILY